MADISISDMQTTTQQSKSYGFVAYTAALAVQDATDALRNINSICTAALGAVLAEALENPAMTEQYNAIAKTIQDTLSAANANFQTTTSSISDMLDKFNSVN